MAASLKLVLAAVMMVSVAFAQSILDPGAIVSDNSTANCDTTPPPKSPPPSTKSPPPSSPPPPTSGSKGGSYPSPPPPMEGKGDPHFTGADNSHFEFSGIPNTTYCLISDSHLHMNAFFGGYYGKYESNAHKSLTWLRKISLLWGRHSMIFEARQGAEWAYNNGYMSRMEVDGDQVVLSKVGETAVLAGGKVILSWVAARELSGDDEIDVYSVEIVGVLKMVLRLRPEIANFRTETDGTVHFDFELTQSVLTASAHGILGQTFRPDHTKRLSQQKLVYSKQLNTLVVPSENGKGFLDGEEASYRSSAMLMADCSVSRFAGFENADSETSFGIEMSAKPKAVGQSGLFRKMLKGN